MSRGGGRICYATLCMFRARARLISERRVVLVFVRFPVAAGDHCLSQSVQTGTGTTQPHLMGTGGSPVVDRSEREPDHFHLTTKLKNTWRWRCTSIPPLPLRDVELN
jgi:hypothetical protein